MIALVDLPAAGRARPGLTDLGALALALAICLGAWSHPAVPLPLAILGTVVAVALRRPLLLVVVGFLLAASLAGRAHEGLAPVRAAPFDGVVTLVADPQRTPFGARVDVRVEGRRLELTASGPAAGAIDAALAGEVVSVRGRLAPPPPDAPWLVPRHVVGRLVAEQVERVGGGAAPWRGANRFRRLLERGSEPLPESARALYSGFVLGDDRELAPAVVDDFRGAGLTHVMVVSGQNVAFLLVLAAPVLGRTSWRGRWVLTMAVIAAFATVTRFEPSILRASAMATVAVTAAAAGRPSSTIRNLALAVGGLVLIDPLLVRSVGFQLSAAASLGIGLLARPVERLIPGPRSLAAAIAVTATAQVGVAPVLLPRFGGIPVVSLLANVVAVPIAGLVTTWGLPAGVVAGLVGSPIADVVHLPTRALIGWVAAVARVAASAPLGELGAGHVVGLVLAIAVAARRPGRPVRLAAATSAVALLLQPGLALGRPPPVQRVDGGGVVHRAGGAVVVVAPSPPAAGPLLGGLRRAGVRRIDLLVVDGGDPGPLVEVLRHRWTVSQVVDARSSPATHVRIGGLEVEARPPRPLVVRHRPP